MNTIDRLSRAQTFFDGLAIDPNPWHNSPPEDLPLAHFLVAMSIVLQGVMVIDGEIHWTEKQLLHQILGEFWEAQADLEQKIFTFLEETQAQKLYLSPIVFNQLRDTLLAEEKCLILTLAFSLSGIDGHSAPREQLYLQNLAQRLDIDHETFHLIQTAFQDPDSIDAEKSAQLRTILSPDILEQTALPLRNLALYLLTPFDQG
jgi:uncharacterized tellurite resistance protein B-like protein